MRRRRISMLEYIHRDFPVMYQQIEDKKEEIKAAEANGQYRKSVLLRAELVKLNEEAYELMKAKGYR